MKLEEIARALVGYIDYTETTGYVDTGIILDYVNMLRAEIGPANAGCDACGTFDRMPGSRFCDQCPDED